MDLRDHFAVQCAAALTGAFSDPVQIARRAYDIADALLAERVRRIDADEARAIEGEAALVAFDPLFDPDALDATDSGWLEPPYDPTWDIDAPPFTPAVAPEADTVRPGLTRTRPASDDAAETARERSTG